MPLVAVALVLASSFFHVAWNTLVKTSGDPLATATRAVGLGVLVLTPFIAVGWLAAGRPTLGPEGWGIALVSGVVSAAYFVPLSAAYRRGALSSVYPVARGSGALLGAVVGVAVLGERLAPAGYVGVALLLGGTLIAALAAASRQTVAPALLAGCAIVGYSALDRVGVRTGPAWLYAWAVWSLCAVWLLAWQRVMRTRAGSVSIPGPGAAMLPEPLTSISTASTSAAVASGAAAAASGAAAAGLRGAIVRVIGESEMRRSLATGVLIIGTYYMILLAFQVAPLAGVAPLREATTILAAAWGVIALGERERAAWRLAGAGAVAAGAILLATSG